jgi:hypothetical protein
MEEEEEPPGRRMTESWSWVAYEGMHPLPRPAVQFMKPPGRAPFEFRATQVPRVGVRGHFADTGRNPSANTFAVLKNLEYALEFSRKYWLEGEIL